MKKIIFFVFGFLVFVGCDSNNKTIENIAEDTGVSKEKADLNLGNEKIFIQKQNVPFFGGILVMYDSIYIMQQISEIAAKHNMLSVKDNVLTVGDVGFGINLRKNGVTLISSTQVDDPKVKRVVEYINDFYGEGMEDEPDNYWWYADGSNDFVHYKTIRLRPLHSDEGGTVIMFYSF